MNCTTARPLMTLMIGGDLCLSEMASLQAHTDECPACQKLLEDMLPAQEALVASQLQTTAPRRSVWPELQLRLTQDSPPPSSRFRFRDLGMVTAIAAACVVMAVAPDWIQFRGSSAPAVVPAQFSASEVITAPSGLALPEGRYQRLYLDQTWEKLEQVEQGTRTVRGY